MRWLRVFGLFIWDFIVGDDWFLAVAVVLAFGVTAGLVAASVPAYWCAPVIIVAALGWSLRRAIRTG